MKSRVLLKNNSNDFIASFHLIITYVIKRNKSVCEMREKTVKISGEKSGFIAGSYFYRFYA